MSNDQELIVMNSQLYDSIKDILDIAKNKMVKIEQDMESSY